MLIRGLALSIGGDGIANDHEVHVPLLHFFQLLLMPRDPALLCFGPVCGDGRDGLAAACRDRLLAAQFDDALDGPVVRVDLLVDLFDAAAELRLLRKIFEIGVPSLNPTLVALGAGLFESLPEFVHHLFTVSALHPGKVTRVELPQLPDALLNTPALIRQRLHPLCRLLAGIARQRGDIHAFRKLFRREFTQGPGIHGHRITPGLQAAHRDQFLIHRRSETDQCISFLVGPIRRNRQRLGTVRKRHTVLILRHHVHATAMGIHHRAAPGIHNHLRHVRVHSLRL